MADKTNWSWLDARQREEFRNRWESVKKMVKKWDDTPLGTSIPLFSNHKSLEKEITDLEDLSLTAYRAMKTLKRQLANGSRDEAIFNDALGMAMREQTTLHLCNTCKLIIKGPPVKLLRADGTYLYCSLHCTPKTDVDDDDVEHYIG